ncbi:unnamed protein product [Rotaria socialis]|uniref:Uncharacterized protein n=1 Tax=Rotaria socialis TaxID=392032 RepID=A0A818A4W3_9BILA|nr:unnamed protein product [Rotaria socialis]
MIEFSTFFCRRFTLSTFFCRHFTLSTFFVDVLLSTFVYQITKQTKIAAKVARRWAQLSKSPQLPPCEQISVLFPNIFKITSRSLGELLAIRTLDIFKVNEQFANVYLRADCSFVKDLPENITTTHITTAINTHNGGQYDQQTVYVQ